MDSPEGRIRNDKPLTLVETFWEVLLLESASNISTISDIVKHFLDTFLLFLNWQVSHIFLITEP